ncbi:MAG: zinc ribbon domain-containing protein [Clostridia bacterium]|nr:zinc ribbon domain-containing protein [Clostridia bacterium]
MEAHNAFCSACGTPRPSKRVCPSCGAECPDGMNFCTRCGSPVPAQSAPAQTNAYAP